MGIAKNLSKNVRKYSKRFWWNFNYKKMQNFISKLVSINVNCQINMQKLFLNTQI